MPKEYFLENEEIIQNNSYFIENFSKLESLWKKELEKQSPEIWVKKKIESLNEIKKKSNPPLYTKETLLNFIVNERDLSPTIKNEIIYLEFFLWYLKKYKDYRRNYDLINKHKELNYLQNRLNILNNVKDDKNIFIAKSSVLDKLKELYKGNEIEAFKHSYICDFGLPLTCENINKLLKENIELNNKSKQAFTRSCEDMLMLCNSDCIMSIVLKKDPYRALYDFKLITEIQDSAEDLKIPFRELYKKNINIRLLENSYINSLDRFKEHQL